MSTPYFTDAELDLLIELVKERNSTHHAERVNAKNTSDARRQAKAETECKFTDDLKDKLKLLRDGATTSPAVLSAPSRLVAVIETYLRMAYHRQSNKGDGILPLELASAIMEASADYTGPALYRDPPGNGAQGHDPTAEPVSLRLVNYIIRLRDQLGLPREAIATDIDGLLRNLTAVIDVAKDQATTPITKSIGEFLFKATCAIHGSAPKRIEPSAHPAALLDLVDEIILLKRKETPAHHHPVHNGVMMDFLNAMHKHLGMFPRSFETNAESVAAEFQAILERAAQLRGQQDPHAVPAHVLDTFISSALKELGHSPFIVLPEQRLQHMRVIMVRLIKLMEERRVPPVPPAAEQKTAVPKNLVTAIRRYLCEHHNLFEQTVNAGGFARYLVECGVLAVHEPDVEDVVSIMLAWRDKLGLAPPLDGGEDLREDAHFRWAQLKLLIQETGNRFAAIDARNRETHDYDGNPLPPVTLSKHRGKMGLKPAPKDLGPAPDPFNRGTGPLTTTDWDQLEMAAAGATSGIENWPWLRGAIQKVCQYKKLLTLSPRESDKYLEMLTEALKAKGLPVNGTVATPVPDLPTQENRGIGRGSLSAPDQSDDRHHLPLMLEGVMLPAEVGDLPPQGNTGMGGLAGAPIPAPIAYYHHICYNGNCRHDNISKGLIEKGARCSNCGAFLDWEELMGTSVVSKGTNVISATVPLQQLAEGEHFTLGGGTGTVFRRQASNDKQTDYWIESMADGSTMLAGRLTPVIPVRPISSILDRLAKVEARLEELSPTMTRKTS